MLANNKTKIVVGIILALLLIVVATATYYFNFYKEDLNKRLPMSVTMNSDDYELEDVAYKFWMNYMQPYQGENVSSWKRLNDVRFNKFQLLAGDESEFAIAVTFWVQLEKKKWSLHHSWGDVQKDGKVKNIQWTFRIKKTGENEFTLVRIEDTSNSVEGLPPVEDEYQKEAGIKVPDEVNRYRIENEKLEVTYDNGGTWHVVPVVFEDLFKGDYNGSKRELIEGSYVIKPEKTAFVIGDGSNMRILHTNDKGETWDENSVSSPFSRGIRMRLLGFTSETNGYLIVTGDRTMSFEANAILKTEDGGETWRNVGSVDGTNRKVTSGGFINEDLGFMSFGSIRINDQKPRPSLYRTVDGGKNWAEVDVPIPIEYQGIFTVAEVPSFDGSQGIMLVNQGPTGDYMGGKVLARFISVDEGATWSFANLVDPDNVIED